MTHVEIGDRVEATAEIIYTFPKSHPGYVPGGLLGVRIGEKGTVEGFQDNGTKVQVVWERPTRYVACVPGAIKRIRETQSGGKA